MTEKMKVHYSSASNEWGTPQALFEVLDKYYHFTLDPCATKENHKCKKYYTIEDNGLSKDWGEEVVFMNPPYSSCLLYTSPSPRDRQKSRMPSSA